MHLSDPVQVEAVSFRLQPVDVWRFQLFTHFRTVSNRILVGLSLVAFLPAFIVFLLKGGPIPAPGLPALVGAGVLGLWPVLFPLVAAAGAWLTFRNRPALAEEQRIEIGDEGFRARSPVGEGFVAWRGIRSIAEDRWNVYVLIDHRMGYIVPKRAFPDPEAAARFAREVRRMWSDARRQAGD